MGAQTRHTLLTYAGDDPVNEADPFGLSSSAIPPIPVLPCGDGNNNDDLALFYDWVRGVSTNQCFGPDDPMTLSLMSDPHQQDVWAHIQNSVDNCPQQEDSYGEDDNVDQPTLENCIKDMGGFALKEVTGHQYDADAYLGSYTEQWWVTDGNSETFYVRDVITLDKFAHPEVLTHHLITNIDSWAPWLGIGLLLGPHAFRPQTLTFEWVENRGVGVLA